MRLSIFLVLVTTLFNTSSFAQCGEPDAEFVILYASPSVEIDSGSTIIEYQQGLIPTSSMNIPSHAALVMMHKSGDIVYKEGPQTISVPELNDSLNALPQRDYLENLFDIAYCNFRDCAPMRRIARFHSSGLSPQGLLIEGYDYDNYGYEPKFKSCELELCFQRYDHTPANSTLYFQTKSIYEEPLLDSSFTGPCLRIENTALSEPLHVLMFIVTDKERDLSTSEGRYHAFSNSGRSVDIEKKVGAIQINVGYNSIEKRLLLTSLFINNGYYLNGRHQLRRLNEKVELEDYVAKLIKGYDLNTTYSY